MWFKKIRNKAIPRNSWVTQNCFLFIKNMEIFPHLTIIDNKTYNYVKLESTEY